MRAFRNDNRGRPEPRVFVEFRPSVRTLIEDAIESLVLLLDEIDGDPDLEPEEDLDGEEEALPLFAFAERAERPP